VNRGKKSVTLDIAKPEGQPHRRALAAKCDVLLENYKVGAWRNTVSPTRTEQNQSRIVYCSITGSASPAPRAPPGLRLHLPGQWGG